MTKHKTEKNSDIAMPERIFQRVVSITTQGTICFILSSSDQGGSSQGWSSGSTMIMTRPLVAKNAHDGVSYLRAFMTGDMASLPETQESEDEHKIGHKDGDRQVGVRSARNGFIVEPASFDGKGWNKAIGDEVVFTDLTKMLEFCMDHLKDTPGTNWWESTPWKEARRS